MTLHLTKLAVGIRDIAHLQDVQGPAPQHHTRSFPKRAGEIKDGGSLYWVVRGVVLVRQRVLDVREDRWDDGTRCAALVLDPALVPVQARLCKPFQGWRYLHGDAAPADVTAGDPAIGADGLPPALRRELQALCLL